MVLLVQCIILCVAFTIAILPAQYRDPLSQYASYPTAIKRRVEELPQYKDYIKQVERKNWKRKIIASLMITVFFAIIAYLSGKTTFGAAFIHVFILFVSVNLYDLIILDIIIFCHSKKLMIPGTEDMEEEYRNPMHHIKGAVKGCIIGILISLISASYIYLVQILI